jgi:hypothetical protein
MVSAPIRADVSNKVISATVDALVMGIVFKWELFLNKNVRGLNVCD